MIASLAMYDFGPAQSANDRLWALIRDGLREEGHPAPDDLTRGEGAYWAAWQSPDLILSQTCGYPFRARLHGGVSYVGTPDYGLQDCPPGHYRSVFVVRDDDPRQTLAEFDGAPFAFSDALSQSGWAAPQTHAALLGIALPPVAPTSGHRLSARAVAEGHADVAGIDAVTWDMMAGVDPVTSRLRVIAETDPTPGLPYIAAAGADVATLRTAVSRAIVALDARDRATLRLKGLVQIPVADYLAVPNPPSPDHFARSA